MQERKESRGCREPSCAKYLTLCANLAKVRFVLGAYGFSHAGVLLTALPAEGILIKKGALLTLFPLSPPSQKLKFPLPLFPPSSSSTPFTTGTGMQHSRREQKDGERVFRKESRGDWTEEGPQTEWQSQWETWEGENTPRKVTRVLKLGPCPHKRMERQQGEGKCWCTHWSN